MDESYFGGKRKGKRGRGAEVADRVIVLKDGEIVEEGEVLNIFDNPQHPYTQDLLSAI